MSLRQAAKKNGMNEYTVQYRVKKLGWDKIDALIIPPKNNHPLQKVTDSQIVECEKQGLTLTRSAYLLKINVSTLSKRIKRMNLHWRGKKNLRGIA